MWTPWWPTLHRVVVNRGEDLERGNLALTFIGCVTFGNSVTSLSCLDYKKGVIVPLLRAVV